MSTDRKSIAQIKKEFAEAKEGSLEELFAQYAMDERSGVKAVLNSYRKKQEKLAKERVRLEEMKEHRKIKKAEFEDEAAEMLAKFGFQDPKRILKSYPFELSGGMQQRVGVAAAMLLKPKILLADEPTSALDVSIQKQVVEQMKMIREQYGTTILIVTHNIGVIRAMADSMLVLKDGKMEEYGKTQEVLSHPQSDYTKRLLAAIPVLRR